MRHKEATSVPENAKAHSMIFFLFLGTIRENLCNAYNFNSFECYKIVLDRII